MLRNLLLAIAAGTVVSSVALADDQMTPNAGMGQSSMAMENSEATSSNADKAFAAVLISHARLQRQISQLVAEKATNPEIKKYAQDLADDAEKIRLQVKTAADKAGITLQQDRMLPRDQAVLDFLKQLPVSSLQRNYVFYQAGVTQTHRLMCEWAAKNAKKQEIKDLAQDLSTKIQTRHETAEKLAQSEIDNGEHMASEEH